MQRMNNNSAPACAACKHQRKKCTDKCVLAPYFPVEKNNEFQAVHKLFGVSNVSKIVRKLNEENRRRAVETLVWEALSREKDPVNGPYGDYHRVCEELRQHKLLLSQLNLQTIQQVPTTQVHHSPIVGQGRMMGWNNCKVYMNNNINGGGIMNNSNNIIQSKEHYNIYPSYRIQETEKLQAERENSSSLILPNQHHLATPLDQHYLLKDMYTNLDSNKSMAESTTWDGSS